MCLARYPFVHSQSQEVQDAMQSTPSIQHLQALLKDVQ
jgi:hypothetical protein